MVLQPVAFWLGLTLDNPQQVEGVGVASLKSQSPLLDVVGLADLYVLTTLDEIHKATVNRLTLVKPPGVPVGLPGQTLECITLAAAGSVVSVLGVGLA